MKLSKDLENKLNTIFVVILAIFIVIFWFIIIPVS